MADDFTIVVFLNTKSNYDVNRFNTIFSPSFKTLKNKCLIIPELVEDLILDSSYKIIYDSEVILDFMCEGYIRHLLLKLYISRFIKTKYYLILDSDIILNKLFRLDDFFYNDKITLHIWNGINYIDKNNYLKEFNTTWVIDSARVLGIELKKINNPFYYSVTPALLHTCEAQELLLFLEYKYHDFVNYFKKNTNCGTEYGLYYLYTKDKNLYIQSDDSLVDAIWYKKDLSKIDNLDKNSIFWVLQSSTKISNEELLRHNNIYSCLSR